MPLMPDSYVTWAEITTDGKLQITVRVDAFQPKDYVEISGQATQTSGAFANFYDIQQVPAAPNAPADAGDPPGTVGHYEINVTGAPTPHQFKDGQAVTCVTRVSKLWLTVLGRDSGVGTEVATGPKWKKVRYASLNGGSW
jgi:hypothetical protein